MPHALFVYVVMCLCWQRLEKEAEEREAKEKMEKQTQDAMYIVKGGNLKKYTHSMMQGSSAARSASRRMCSVKVTSCLKSAAMRATWDFLREAESLYAASSSVSSSISAPCLGFDWAAAEGLAVNRCLHGAPGGQSGHDACGRADAAWTPARWDDDATVRCVARMAARFGAHRAWRHW